MLNKSGNLADFLHEACLCHPLSAYATYYFLRRLVQLSQASQVVAKRPLPLLQLQVQLTMEHQLPHWLETENRLSPSSTSSRSTGIGSTLTGGSYQEFDIASHISESS